MADEFLLESQTTAIRALEALIEEIRAGNVVEWIGVAIMVDDKYRYYGGIAEDRHRTAGMLLDLAIEKLR